MPIIFLFVASFSFAQSKAEFFPRFPMGSVIEERSFPRGIERNLERQRDTYRYVVNYEKLGKMPMAVAAPILQLSMYSLCAMTATEPLIQNFHYEPAYTETYFICTVTPTYDPVKMRKRMKDKYCAGSILSKAQEMICKELLLL